MRQEQQLFPRQNASVLSATACESEKLWVSMGEKSPLSGSTTQAHSSGITMNELWGCRVFPCFYASLFFGNNSHVSVVIHARFPRSRNGGQNCRFGQQKQPIVKQNVVELTVVWMKSCFGGEKDECLSGENIPEGVTIAWDHPCVTSETLLSRSQTMEAGRSSSPKCWQRRGKKNPMEFITSVSPKHRAKHFPDNFDVSGYQVLQIPQT